MAGEKDGKWVEDLLREARFEVADAGFSRGVAEKVAAFEQRRLKILAPFFALGIAALVVFFPYDIFQGAGLEYDMNLHLLLPVLIVLGMAVFFTFSEEGGA